MLDLPQSGDEKHPARELLWLIARSIVEMMISRWSVRFRIPLFVGQVLYFSFMDWYWFIHIIMYSVVLLILPTPSTKFKVFRLFETSQRGMLRLGGSVSGCRFGRSAFHVAARVRTWNDMMLSSIVSILFLLLYSVVLLYKVRTGQSTLYSRLDQ